MSKYHFSGRIASFFRATGNSWASSRTIGETVGRLNVRGELENLHGYGHIERRGKRGSYEYRWNPNNLYLANAAVPK